MTKLFIVVALHLTQIKRWRLALSKISNNDGTVCGFLFQMGPRQLQLQTKKFIEVVIQGWREYSTHKIRPNSLMLRA